MKLKITTKSQIEKRQAGTKDDSEQKDEDLFVCPNNAKPHVVRRLSHEILYEFDIFHS